MGSSAPGLDLSSVPPIYILSSHLTTEELHEYEDHVYAAGGALTYNASEAKVFLGRISQKKRAAFDLRSKGIWTEPAEVQINSGSKSTLNADNYRGLKRKHSDSLSVVSITSSEDQPRFEDQSWPDLNNRVLVLKLGWLDDCLAESKQIPYQKFIVYSGRVIGKPSGDANPHNTKSSGVVTYIKATPGPSSTSPTMPTSGPPPPRPFSSATQISHHPRTSPNLTRRPPPKLHRTTTSEFEGTHNPTNTSSGASSPTKLRRLPEWATHPTNHSYACCRSTPFTTPNDLFLAQLQHIKLARILTLDAIGVRAYSTSIAAIAAYPFPLTTESEILRLPGCNSRIAELWREWYDSSPTPSARTITYVTALLDDDDLKVLRLFYGIWGVGAETARRLYYTHGLRDLDDVVEYHWGQLTRVQQIGVKFYEEFERGIPRAEVEGIAEVVRRHARLVRGVASEEWGGSEDVVCVIVGGYRRGKAESGDVDVILSHREEGATRDLVVDVVRSLETEGWVTHTLSLQTTTSERGEQTLPFRGEGHGGHGFDSLDKALCVWQDPVWDDEGGKVVKNPNVHRRVDIILSPWRTVGCAVLGWSGGTTFQRDLRRYAAKVKGWKFDSSGVRDRGSGVVVDLEGDADSWEERERRVMEGIGVGYRPPEERCTG